MLRLRSILLSLVVLGLSACANLQQEILTELQREISTTEGALVISRASGGSRLEPDVTLNGVTACRLDDNSYCIVRLRPGNYRVAVSGYFQQPGFSNFVFRTLAMNVQIIANSTQFAKIDTTINSGYILPLPGLVVGGMSGTISIAASNMDEFLSMRSWLRDRRDSVPLVSSTSTMTQTPHPSPASNDPPVGNALLPPSDNAPPDITRTPTPPNSAEAQAPKALPTTQQSSNVEQRLRELKKLADEGLISQEIYLEQQRKLLQDSGSK